MKKVSLTLLVANYQQTGCDDSFTKLYRILAPTLENRTAKYARHYRLDEQDVASKVDEKLIDVVSKFNRANGEFLKQLNTAIKYGCIDLVRKQTRQHEINLTGLTANIPEEEAKDFLDKVAPIDFRQTSESDAIKKVQKSSEQPKLLANLLSLADEDTRQSASAYMMSGSYGEAAKLLGTDKMKVHRHIKRLATRFDGNQFGNYHDYFTVETVSAG